MGVAASWLVAAAAFGGDETEAVSGPARIGLAGGPDALWVYVGDGGGAAASLRFAVLRHQPEREESFGLIPLGPIGGEVRRAAVCGEVLHLFFADGSHRSVPHHVTPPQFGEPAAGLQIEVELPEKSTLPAAVAGDAANDRLWAVVRNHVALQIDELEARLLREAEIDRQDVDAATEPPRERYIADPDLAKEPQGEASGEAAPALSAADYVLAYYDGGRWHTDRDLPEQVTEGTGDLRLAVRDGHVALTYRPEEAAPVMITLSTSVAAPWSPPQPVVEAGGAEVLALGFMGDGPSVVVDDPALAESRLSVRTLRAEGWTQARPLSVPADATFPQPAPVAAAFYADQAALAASDDQGQPLVGRWSVADGSCVSGWARVNAFTAMPYARIRQWLGHAIEFGLVIVLLGILYLRRHDSTLAAVPLQRGQLLAPLSARAAAFVLDAVILAPVLAGVLMALELPITPMQIQELSRSDDGLPGGRVWWMLVVISATFAAYGSVFDAALGATPGKRILGLRVVVSGGGPCTLRAALIRNVLRVVDFEFPPALFLVLMTLNRQRLGDVLARTVVVTHAADLGPESGSDDQKPDAEEPTEADKKEGDETGRSTRCSDAHQISGIVAVRSARTAHSAGFARNPIVAPATGPCRILCGTAHGPVQNLRLPRRNLGIVEQTRGTCEAHRAVALPIRPWR